MQKSLSVSSESSLPPPDEDVDSVCSDDLMGSQSRRWLADLRSDDIVDHGSGNTFGRDGLFVDYNFPLGELEMHSGIKWKRPKVKKTKTSYAGLVQNKSPQNSPNIFI